MARIELRSAGVLASWVALCVAAVSGACGEDTFHQVGSISDAGSAGAPDSETGGAAGANDQGRSTGGKDGGKTGETGGRAGETGGRAGETGGRAGETGVSGSTGSSSCENGVRDGTETDVDCGGDCPGCRRGNRCDVTRDCEQDTCVAGLCSEDSTPTCNDGIKNGDETDVDCGGQLCAQCEVSKTCLLPVDCINSVCADGICAFGSCVDRVPNGAETDVDCGGGVCPSCVEGQTCMVAADCDGGECVTGVCLASPIPSRQSVTFRVHNGADSPRALEVDGYLCSAFAIYRLDGDAATLVNREVRYENGICLFGDYTMESTLVWLAPDETRELEWDAREQQIVYETVECSELVAEPDLDTAEVPIGIARPVTPGQYQIEIAFLVGTPDEQSCLTEQDGVRCMGGFTTRYRLGDICELDPLQRMTAPFTLPDTGDAVVDIELT